MFIVEKRQKSVTLDSIADLIAESICNRSLKPMTLLFRKGRYGSRGHLTGSYVDYRKYLGRKERRINFKVVE